jgi:cytochrome c-type biogenesis protein CcmE
VHIVVAVVVVNVVADALGSGLEFVQAEISHFENPATVNQTVRGFQITVRLDGRVVQINHPLRDTKKKWC